MVIFRPSGRTAYRGISAGNKDRLKLSIKEELIKEWDALVSTKKSMPDP